MSETAELKKRLEALEGKPQNLRSASKHLKENQRI